MHDATSKSNGKLKPVIERILDRVVPSAEGCWGWTGYVAADGYAVFRHQDGNTRAHRAVYEHLVGAIPVGLELDHICHNKSCTNPAHLRPVTKSQNQQNWDRARADSSTGIRGVRLHKASGLYMAEVAVNGQRVYCKYFKTAEEAEAAATEARNRYHTHNDRDRAGAI